MRPDEQKFCKARYRQSIQSSQRLFGSHPRAAISKTSAYSGPDKEQTM
jgi:hypothetical protein